MATDNNTPELFTLAFWQHTITQVVHGIAAGALGPLLVHQAELIGSVPWYGILSSGAVGGIVSLLGTLSTTRIPDRVPGSFLKETELEKRLEREIMLSERSREARRLEVESADYVRKDNADMHYKVTDGDLFGTVGNAISPDLDGPVLKNRRY